MVNGLKVRTIVVMKSVGVVFHFAGPVAMFLTVLLTQSDCDSGFREMRTSNKIPY